jgi:hypothetical protein
MPDREIDREAFLRRVERRARIGRRMTWLQRKLLGSERSRYEEVDEWTFPTDRERVMHYYALNNDHLPDLDQPAWLNEKIRWQFLNHPNPLMSLAADKRAVRDYLAYKGAAIQPPALHATLDDPEAILEVDLPERFVFKPTFSSRRVHVEDGVGEGQPTPRADLVRKAAVWSRKDLWRGTGELHYRPIPRRWIVEEYVPGRRRLEYRLFCFMGEPVYYSVIIERKGEAIRHAVLDLDGRPFRAQFAGFPSEADVPPPPPDFDRMLADARLLSEDFLHVRVDFFVHDDRTMFSELTFSSLAAVVNFDSDAANDEIGALMDLGRADAYLARGRRIAEAVGRGERAAAEMVLEN